MRGRLVWYKRQSEHTNCMPLSRRMNSVRFPECFLLDTEADRRAGGHAESEMGRFCPQSCECYFTLCGTCLNMYGERKRNVMDEEKERAAEGSKGDMKCKG